MLATLAVVGLVLLLATGVAKGLAAPPRETSYALFPADKPRKGRKVMVTGGAGFLGSYIVDAVQSKGRDCQVVVFDLRVPPPEARKAGVSYVRGNVCNAAHLKRAMEGVESVFHAAGVTPSVVISDAKLFHVNVKGTRAVVSAARQAGVARLVFTSSATVTLGRDDWETWAADESRPYPEVHIGAYGASKQLAEQAVLGARGQGLRVAVCRPAAIFGIGDRQVADPLLSRRATRYLGTGKARMDWLDAWSVAHGHVLAEEALSASPDTADGEVFNLGSGADMEYGEMFSARGLWGFHSQSIPLGVARALAVVNEAIARCTGAVLLDAALSRYGVNFTQRTYTFSIAKAQRVLGYEPLYTVKEVRAAAVPGGGAALVSPISPVRTARHQGVARMRALHAAK